MRVKGEGRNRRADNHSLPPKGTEQKKTDSVQLSKGALTQLLTKKSCSFLPHGTLLQITQWIRAM